MSNGDYHAEAEREILKKMQPKMVVYYATDFALTGIAIGAASSAGISTGGSLAAGALSLAIGLALTASKSRTCRKRNKKLLSALNNQEQKTIDSIILSDAERQYWLSRGETKESGFGKMPLEMQLEAVAEEVNLLLGYDGMPLPRIVQSTELKEYNGDYRSGLIRVKADTPPQILAHEYCHHVVKLKSQSLDWLLQTVLEEGLADALGAAAGESYALKTGESNMEKDALSKRISCLSDFKFLFKNEFLLRMEGAEHMANYCVGPTAFLVAEKKHGTGIYRQVLDSKGPHKLLVDMVCGSKV